MAELEDTLGYDEWVSWVAFHSLYDLPDGFLVTGQLGALVAQVAGGKATPGTFAPYFEPPPSAPKRSNLGAAFARLNEYVPHKRRKPE